MCVRASWHQNPKVLGWKPCGLLKVNSIQGSCQTYKVFFCPSFLVLFLLLSLMLCLGCFTWQCFDSFKLTFRCGDSIVVLGEGFKHLSQATHLSKVSTPPTYMDCFFNYIIHLCLSAFHLYSEKKITIPEWLMRSKSFITWKLAQNNVSLQRYKSIPYGATYAGIVAPCCIIKAKQCRPDTPHRLTALTTVAIIIQQTTK